MDGRVPVGLSAGMDRRVVMGQAVQNRLAIEFEPGRGDGATGLTAVAMAGLATAGFECPDHGRISSGDPLAWPSIGSPGIFVSPTVLMW